MKHLALTLALLTCSASPALSQSIPVHGNYCGLGHSGSNATLQPTDQLDAACARHDYCVGIQGRFSCGCDIGFMQELRTMRWPNPGIQTKARAIYDSIGMLPCSDPRGMAVKTEMVMGDLTREVFSGNEAPSKALWEILRRWRYLGRDGVSGGS